MELSAKCINIHACKDKNKQEREITNLNTARVNGKLCKGGPNSNILNY